MAAWNPGGEKRASHSQILLDNFSLFAVFSRVTWERGTTRSAKEVRNVDCDSFIQTKNTPDSGNLQKVLITVSTRKVIIQDMISKVFDQTAVDFSLQNSLYVNNIYHISRWRYEELSDLSYQLYNS